MRARPRPPLPRLRSRFRVGSGRVRHLCRRWVAIDPCPGAWNERTSGRSGSRADGSLFSEPGCPATIEMCPLADASLLKLLGSRRYRMTEFSSVLIRPLNRKESFPPLNTGVRVRRASPTEVDLWVSTVAQSFYEEGVFP